MSIGINGFLIPYELVDGGLVGIGLILHYYFGYPAGLSMFILSIPLFIVAWCSNRAFFYNSLFGLVVSSLFIDLFSFMNGDFHVQILTSAILGGVFVGTGIGLMLAYDTSTCGMDLIAQLLGKITGINVGLIIFVIDGLVITSGFQAVGREKFLYSIITIVSVGVMTFFLIARKKENSSFL